MFKHIDNKKQASEKLQAIGKNAVLCSRNYAQMSIIYSNIHNINRNIGTLACNKNNIEICRKVIKLQIKFCGIIANIWDENSTQMCLFCLKHVVT